MKIYPGAHVTGNIANREAEGDIGDGCEIHTDLFNGDGIHIAVNCSFVGKHPVQLADGATISPGCMLATSRPEVNSEYRNKHRGDYKIREGPIKLGKDVYLGANVVIEPGINIADGVAVGANSYVYESITNERVLWAGNPAEYIDDLPSIE